MAVDLNATLNNMLDSMKSVSTKATDAPKDLMDIITGAFDRMVTGITRSAGVSFIAKLGGQSIFSQAESEGLGVINKAAATLSAKGGALAELVMGQSGLNFGGFDFKGLVASAVEPVQHMMAEMHGTHMSYGELGSLTPMVTFGGSVVSQGISIG